MNRPEYLSNYLFDWDLLDVVVSGKSALDSSFFMGPLFTSEEVSAFLKGYGFDPNDPVSRAELFGNFQEAIQFIKRYFLREGSLDGVDISIPNSLLTISKIEDLFLMATGKAGQAEVEERLWGEAILKVMHTILHVDKDLHVNYFKVIQTQVLDRFYKFIYRDKENKLFLGIKGAGSGIPLLDFQTKSQKGRDSVIIKLLHKVENVAEEIFDRVGIRFITEERFDILRAIKFLIDNNIVVPHNIKPSRSLNTMIDLKSFRETYKGVIKMAIRNDLSEERFLHAMERAMIDNDFAKTGGEERNLHTSKKYKSVQFTCRQLISYKNPFLKEFTDLRNLAKGKGDDELAKKILGLDSSLISREVRFFYPFEIQIVDEESYKANTEGEASHQEYKRNQLKSAMRRVLKPLLDYHGIET